MSLKQRVACAAQGQPGSSDDGRLTAEELKRRMQEVLPTDRVAAILAEHPLRARSEVRRACQVVLADSEWVGFSKLEKEGLVDEVIDAIFGFGPLEPMLLDESITEIMVNGFDSIFFEREGRLFRSEARFESNEQIRALIDRILGPLGRRIDESSPMVNARLPEGHRVNAVIAPLSLDGPALTIRKFTQRVMTLGQMQQMGSMDPQVRQVLEWSVLMRKNMAVSGSTGSGKTTLLNALSCVIPKEERIVTIEDSAELRFLEHPHVVRLEARPANAEGVGAVTIRDLVVNSLRMRPDRIVVGECRGAEALDMLQAMSTGHDGSLTTLHANSAAEVVSRLTTLVRYAAELPVDVVEAQVGHAIDVVVQVARAADGSRYVEEVAELSFCEERRKCQVRTLFRRLPWEPDGTWLSHPSWVEELVLRNVARPEEVDQWKRDCSQSQRDAQHLDSRCA